jgi:hypothetical protein
MKKILLVKKASRNNSPKASKQIGPALNKHTHEMKIKHSQKHKVYTILMENHDEIKAPSSYP